MKKLFSSIVGMMIAASFFAFPTNTLASSAVATNIMHRSPFRIRGNEVITMPRHMLFRRSSGEHTAPIVSRRMSGHSRRLSSFNRPSARTVDRESKESKFRARSARDAQLERMGIRQRANRK